MSSATSTDPSSRASRDLSGRPSPETLRPLNAHHSGGRVAAPASRDEAALQPWQFFLLAGMLCATAVVIVATGQSAASIIVLSLTVVAASLVALGAYRVLAPLVGDAVVVDSAEVVGRARAALEREKTLVLRSIKELEFDFAMGKIAKSDFDEMTGKLRARAIGLMRQLDAGGSYRELIEQELMTRLQAARTESVSDPVADRAVPDAAPTGDDDVSSPLVCACGATNDADARFCKGCGTRINA